MPSRTEWRTAFTVGLFLFGPGLEDYLRQRADAIADPDWSRFYDGLANIVHRAGTDPDHALELADGLYNRLWGRPRRRRLPSGRAK